MQKGIPDGWNSITPRLVVHDTAGLVRAFDATGDFRADRSSGMRIGDSKVMVSEAGQRDAETSFLYLKSSCCRSRRSPPVRSAFAGTHSRFPLLSVKD